MAILLETIKYKHRSGEIVPAGKIKLEQKYEFIFFNQTNGKMVVKELIKNNGIYARDGLRFIQKIEELFGDGPDDLIINKLSNA